MVNERETETETLMLMGETKMEKILTALAMVIIGGLMIWLTFGPIVTNAINTIMTAL